MSRDLLAEIGKLGPSERIQLVEGILRSLAAEDMTVTKVQQEELDRRVAALEKDPDRGIPWKDVKKELLTRK